MSVPTSLLGNTRAMRKEPSRAESALWKLLRDRRLEGFKFRRQHPLDR
jgi:very-short-patch-repair endonuclease